MTSPIFPPLNFSCKSNPGTNAFYVGNIVIVNECHLILLVTFAHSFKVKTNIGIKHLIQNHWLRASERSERAKSFQYNGKISV